MDSKSKTKLEQYQLKERPMYTFDEETQTNG